MGFLIRENIAFNNRPDLCIDSEIVENCFVENKCKKRNIVVGSIYMSRTGWGGGVDSIYQYVMQLPSFIPFGWQDIYFVGGHDHDTPYGGPCLVY